MRATGSTCLSAQMPASPGVIRPSGETALASAMTKPAPPTARDPRCTRCQSVATPSSDEYSHMGETPMRLRNVTDLMASGENKCEFLASLFMGSHFSTILKENQKFPVESE